MWASSNLDEIIWHMHASIAMYMRIYIYIYINMEYIIWTPYGLHQYEVWYEILALKCSDSRTSWWTTIEWKPIYHVEYRRSLSWLWAVCSLYHTKYLPGIHLYRRMASMSSCVSVCADKNNLDTCVECIDALSCYSDLFHLYPWYACYEGLRHPVSATMCWGILGKVGRWNRVTCSLPWIVSTGCRTVDEEKPQLIKLSMFDLWLEVIMIPLNVLGLLETVTHTAVTKGSKQNRTLSLNIFVVYGDWINDPSHKLLCTISIHKSTWISLANHPLLRVFDASFIWWPLKKFGGDSYRCFGGSPGWNSTMQSSA